MVMVDLLRVPHKIVLEVATAWFLGLLNKFKIHTFSYPWDDFITRSDTVRAAEADMMGFPLLANLGERQSKMPRVDADYKVLNNACFTEAVRNMTPPLCMTRTSVCFCKPSVNLL